MSWKSYKEPPKHNNQVVVHFENLGGRHSVCSYDLNYKRWKTTGNDIYGYVDRWMEIPPDNQGA